MQTSAKAEIYGLKNIFYIRIFCNIKINLQISVRSNQPTPLFASADVLCAFVVFEKREKRVENQGPLLDMLFGRLRSLKLKIFVLG
jgi:hypothetical protein